MPGAIPEIVILAPVPAIAPGLIVQFPEGKPLKTTLPVGTVQVGWVIVPTIGAEGVIGWVPITILAEGNEMQPAPLLTVKVYVPVANPEMVVVVPEPVIAPGLIVQFPAGKPVKNTLPVATVHDGCVIVPIVGAGGVPGFAIITISAEANEMHPTEFVTV